MKKLSVIILISVVLFSLGIQSLASNTMVNSSTESRQFDEGTVNFNSWLYVHDESSSNQYQIEYGINLTVQTKMEIKNISQDYYQFSFDNNYQFKSAFQKRTGVEYSPISYGLRYLNSSGDLLKSDNTTLSYSYTINLNKSNGLISLADNPFGASEVALTAYFGSNQVYSYIYYPVSLYKVGNTSSDFYPNATTWEIGGQALSKYTTTGETTLNNYSVWKLKNNENIEGADISNVTILVEKSTGLVIQESLTLTKSNFYTIEGFVNSNDFSNVIKPKTDTTTTTTTSKSSHSTDSFLLYEVMAGLILIISIKKKFKYNK